MDIAIDCTQIFSARELHEALHKTLQLPQWYGYNLDALYDCLTAITEETTLTFEHFLPAPAFARGFMKVFSDADRKNPHLSFRFL